MRHDIPQETVETWRNMLKMGYSLRAIGREYKLDSAIIRYHTNPDYKAQHLEHLRKTYDPDKRKLRTLVEKARKAKPDEIITMPEVHVPEYFGNTPEWPKPLWLASFEARRKKSV